VRPYGQNPASTDRLGGSRRDSRRHLACRCRIRQNGAVLRDWLWRGGRLRYGVTMGLLFGVCMGAFLYWVGSPRSAVGAVIGGVVAGAGSGSWIAVSRYAGGLLFSRELSELPPPDRVAVLRAVMRGEPVSDPRLAPSMLACAKSVMALVRRQQAPLWRWMLFAFAGLGLVIALWKTSTGRVWQAVFFWAATVIIFGFGCTNPRALVRSREKAEAAADYAADQIGRSSAD
jgi:hypothetical protein